MDWLNKWHLGDCYWHALFLRKLGGSHRFYCPQEHHAELSPVFVGRDVELLPHEEATSGAFDCWIGNRDLPGNFIDSGSPKDIIGFLVDWFKLVSKSIGEDSPIKKREDLLSGYPGLAQATPKQFDILFINSKQGSNQCPGLDESRMSWLIMKLSGRHRVLTTSPRQYSITEIGLLSKSAKCIIGTVNGPMWPTFNIWNVTTPRFLFLDPQVINFSPDMPIQHHGHIAGMTRALKEAGWL